MSRDGGGGNLDDTAEHLSFDRIVAKHFEPEPRTHARVEVAGRSHAGKVRPNNEDHFLIVRRYRGREVIATNLPAELLGQPEDHAYTLAVADGMGGRAFGDLASLLALLTGWELGGDEIKWTVKMNDQEEEDFRQKADLYFRLINQALLDQVGENPRLAGMGTTLTLCYTTGCEMFVLHVGDSRVYLHREGTLSRLTRDHNVAQFLVDQKLIAPDSPEARRVSHVLTNVLGGPDHRLEVDVHRHRLADGDRLLLCTDGLNDMVSDAEIARVLDANPVSGDACAALESLALERGGKDNVTVVVARYVFLTEPTQAERVVTT